MKKLLLIPALLISLASSGSIVVHGPVAAPAGWTQRATDDFTAHASGDLTQNASWIAQTGSLGYDGVGKVGGNSGVDNVYYYNVSVTATQRAQVTLVTGGGGGTAMGAAVRVQSSGVNCYGVWYNSFAGGLELIKINAGTRAAITSNSHTYVNGDKLLLEVTGTGSATRLTAYADTGSGFVAVFTSVDPGGTYIDGGKIGLVSASAFSGLDLTNFFAYDQ